MRRLNLTPLNPEQISEFGWIIPHNPRRALRARAQMILLAGEQGMSAQRSR